MRLQFLFCAVVLWCLGLPLQAEERTPAPDDLREAIRRSIPLLEKGAAGSAKQRKCFTCHNQALPVLALVEAQQRGFTIDEAILKQQLQHTFDHLQRGRKGYLQGRGQGGRVITAGYALWALEAGGWAADDTTAAVTHYLLETQKQADHWRHPGNRPPSSGSDFTTSYVALHGLAHYGTKEQQARIESRTETIRAWLLSAEPRDTEDSVFRLRGLTYANVDEQTVNQAIQELLATQQADGGWAQTAELQSDAYATSTVLAALLRAGSLPRTHASVNRGLQFLVDAQQEDGSWQVVSRAKPFQTYFESGFPHGKDQFISISASSWATLAMLLTLPESPLE